MSRPIQIGGQVLDPRTAVTDKGVPLPQPVYLVNQPTNIVVPTEWRKLRPFFTTTREEGSIEGACFISIKNVGGAVALVMDAELLPGRTVIWHAPGNGVITTVKFAALKSELSITALLVE